MIYRNDNYECIQTIKDAHNDYIMDFIELKEGSIISCSNKIMKEWNIMIWMQEYFNIFNFLKI